MKTVLFSLLFMLGRSLTAIAADPGDESLKINTTSSSIGWKAKKVTGEHQGSVMVKQGNLQITKGKLMGGSVTIDMNSIKCTDLQGEYAGKLEGHLKSEDFFGVAQYPEATITVLDVKSKGNNQFDVKANITIKGITQPIEFPATVKPEGKNYKAEAMLTIDRSLFNVKYGSGKFYEDLGDKTIYDDFELNISLVTQ